MSVAKESAMGRATQVRQLRADERLGNAEERLFFWVASTGREVLLMITQKLFGTVRPVPIGDYLTARIHLRGTEA